MSAPLRIALIGAGSMGRNHARVIAESPDTELSVVIDVDAARAHQVTAQHGGSPETSVAAVRGCDAAIVAASTGAHVELGTALLGERVPLLIEKPVATTYADVDALVSLSRAQDTPLMCGFVERFNAALAATFSTIDDAPRHVVALRHSPHSPQATTSVVWDLLIHDIDTLVRLARRSPSEVVSGSLTLPPLGIVEVADATLRFDGDLLGTLSSSRGSQRKIRSWQIATDSALFEVDLLRQDISIYRHISAELIVARHRPRYRADTSIEIPFVRHNGEPLAEQLRHFVRLLRGEADVEAERTSILAPHAVAAKIAGS
jgi:predicted dehydrogenase